MPAEMDSISKRARAFSVSLFNRERSNSLSLPPVPPSPTKPTAGAFLSSASTHSTPSTDSPPPAPTPPGRDSKVGHTRPTSVVLPFMMSSGNGAHGGAVLPEMVNVFRHLTEHGQKVYHEGYFQKLNDMNPDGSAVANREWTDCFAQLIGTILTIWDDKAIQEEEERARKGHPTEPNAVKPVFLNLTDASMKMIDSLPQRASGEPLQNVLSLSTAGRNRYLLHFASALELAQWTAAIRLSMFEHNSLQEAYTGALVAAKGRSLNSIGTILERSKFKVEDWTRVRFGAGTPWKRYWTVITPPDEKAYQKAKKAAKKASKQAGAQVRPEPVLGDIKFYDTNKIKKKTPPVATISSAFAAYAIYPESNALIDQSTLIKIEGTIVINSDPPFTSEGITFMMPDHHPAVSGFEMLMRFLIPTYDVFHLYGRPNKLVADTIDPRSLLFAFPKGSGSPYCLLDTADIVGVINERGSNSWTESEWRKKLKQTASKVQISGRGMQRANLASPSTASLPAQLGYGTAIGLEGGAGSGRNSTNSQRPGFSNGYTEHEVLGAASRLSRQASHSRSMSEAQGTNIYGNQNQTVFAPGVSAVPPSSMQTYGGTPAAYTTTNASYPSQQASQPPQAYGNGYGSPNSRPPSSRSQRSQTSQRSQNGQYAAYRSPGQQGQPSQGGPGPSAYRGDPRGAGGFDPSLGGRQPPQLQTADLASSYPMPTASPNSARAPPAPAHSFSPVANARAMSRLSVGTLQMMHANGNNAGPVPTEYRAQGHSPTLGFHPQIDNSAAQRTQSYGSSDSGQYSSSQESEMAVARAYTTQPYMDGVESNGVVSPRMPQGNDVHTDLVDDFDLATELRQKQLEAASRNGALSQGMYANAPYPQHAYPLPDAGYGSQQYGNGQDGSAQSVRGYYQ